ncbi:hypothetical protein B9Z55_007123 [Caenorhabditis nigoni]|uniref:Receptor L-domain domain-containing protein n=1 Tax=Caenorhabditis nigoni TaxID=1611254 RepID=A0A2G5V8W7_9PELO|nr:hypothetical protein B9Z55_007123 [Caenorhabditis nigoni]
MYFIFLLSQYSIFVTGQLENDTIKLFSDRMCEFFPDPACTFMNKTLTKSNIDKFPNNCTTVCADFEILWFSELSEDKLRNAFKNMKHLIGNVHISETRIVKCDFLAGLESIDTEIGEITIRNNENMTELNLSSLATLNCTTLDISENGRLEKIDISKLQNLTRNGPKMYYMSPGVGIILAYLSPKFCIKFDEMEHFLSIENGDFSLIYANYCTPVLEDNICTKPEANCTRFFGDLIIGPNFTDQEKLRSLVSIFGRLVINGSDFENLNFLENLIYIAPLGWGNTNYTHIKYNNSKSYAVQILNNAKLEDYYFPALKRVRSDSKLAVTIKNNNEELLYNSKSCEKLENALIKEYIQVDGKYCSNIGTYEYLRDQRRMKRLIVFCGVGVAILIIFLIVLYCCCKKEK